jgi:ArsR family transcriptional regulator
MEIRRAVEAFAALAQEHRLAVFRLMISDGAGGLTAGEIALRLAIPPSTLSHHLAHLERAGLLRSWRVDRRIFYAVDVQGTRTLVTFLTEDCCGGHPEICGYAKAGSCRDDHVLPQPRLRTLAKRTRAYSKLR